MGLAGFNRMRKLKELEKIKELEEKKIELADEKKKVGGK